MKTAQHPPSPPKVGEPPGLQQVGVVPANAFLGCPLKPSEEKFLNLILLNPKRENIKFLHLIRLNPKRENIKSSQGPAEIHEE